MDEVMELVWHDYETGERARVAVNMPPREWWRAVKTGDEVVFRVRSVIATGPESPR